MRRENQGGREVDAITKNSKLGQPRVNHFTSPNLCVTTKFVLKGDILYFSYRQEIA